jgi:DNA-binding beta-propeller fold protein YncE
MAPTDEETALPASAAAEREKGETSDEGNSNIFMIALVLIVIGAMIGIIVAAVGSNNDESRAVVPPAESVGMNFNRISNFPACLQFDATCNFDNETVAEIISASEDGNTLFYTDGAQESLGFIDITDPSNPKALGVVDVGGEPTSTAVLGPYALVCVNTSPNFTNPSGVFHVIDIETRTVLRTGDLGGQPDSIAISPDGKFAAIVIENERDEDVEDGVIPQLPSGFMQIMDTSSDNVDEWTLSVVDLTGLDGALYPSDAEPEYVAINTDNIGKFSSGFVNIFSFSTNLMPFDYHSSGCYSSRKQCHCPHRPGDW